MYGGQERQRVLRAGTYVRVWLALIILTCVTVSVAGMDFGRVSIGLALVIAGVKSGLVLNYFMHLKQERQPVLRWMIPGVLTILILFIGIVFLDVVLR